MRTKKSLKFIVSVGAIISLIGCSGTGGHEPRIFKEHPLAVSSGEHELTDKELLAYAARRYDSSANWSDAQLGRHNGTPVIEAFYCGDLCPLNTVRVIHYKLQERQTCTGAGGVERKVRMPRRQLTYQNFCIPKGIGSPDEIGALIID